MKSGKIADYQVAIKTADIMICLDTNIIIYLGKGTLSSSVIGPEPICYASVTRIESLGYVDIKSGEEQRISQLLATLAEVPLSEPIIQRTIDLKQLSKMKLGDAIIAATAIETGSVLWTANLNDFAHITDLKVVNPLRAAKRR